MISIKSNREIALMEEAGRIVALAHKAVKEAIAPGVTTAELDEVAEKVILAHGATPSFKGYNASQDPSVLRLIMLLFMVSQTKKLN